MDVADPESIAPHWVRRALNDPAHADQSAVTTTMDAGLQRTVLGILRAQRHMLEKHHAQQVSVVVLDNHTREFRVWVTAGSDIDAAMTPRQPGSALKGPIHGTRQAGWPPLPDRAARTRCRSP